jgi:hypothetical protein
MQTETLLEKTYRLLDASRLTYREIAAGAAVDINWLGKLKQRAIADPGVGKIERLHNFLSGQAPTNELPNESQRMGALGNG